MSRCSAAVTSGSEPRSPTSRTGDRAARTASAARVMSAVGAGPIRGTVGIVVSAAAVTAAATSAGNTTAVAPRGWVAARRNALATVSATSSGASTSPTNLVTVPSRPAASMDWCVCLIRWSRGTAPQIATTGSCSVVAVTSPVAKLLVPGPDVTRTTPGVPVNRPIAAAMNAAFCSWRHTTSSADPSSSASTTASILVPGIPNTYRTPARSSASTTRWAERTGVVSISHLPRLVLGRQPTEEAS